MSGAFAETADHPDSPSDGDLIAAVRRGDATAFGVLYERHLGAARRVAASFAATPAEREDLIAEAFTRVLRMLRAGRGPDEGFRPYLLTTMRNAVINWRRQDSAVSLYADVPDSTSAAGYDDPMGKRLHATVAADAFASLPERWRLVLWHTEVEGESPAQIAPKLGMTPNGVAALAYRAREGLRQAYLDQHLPTVGQTTCRTVVSQLAGWVRHSLTARKMRRITAHLDQCTGCRDLATRLSRLNHELPALLAPVVLGVPLAVAAGSAATSTAVVTGAATGMTLPTASWLASMKAMVAGAAILTTAAVSSVASDPAPATGGTGGGEVAVSLPSEHRATTTAPTKAPVPATTRAAAAGPRPGTSSSPVPSTTPSAPQQTTGAPATESTQDTKAADREAKAETKAERKAAKQAAKQAKKDAKQDAKEETKPGKKAK